MSLRYPIRILLLGLGLGWAFDFLFFNKWPGVSVLIYAFLLLVGLGLALRWQQVSVRKSGYSLIPLLLLFAAGAMWRANHFLVFLNVMAAMMVLVLLMGNWAWQSVWELKVQALLLEPMRVSLMSVARAFDVLRWTNQPLRQDLEGKYARFVPAIIKGLLISIPILLVLISLLISADMVFAQWVKQLLSLDKVLEWGFRIILMLVFGVLAAGGLAFTLLGSSFEPSSQESEAPQEPFITLGIIETLIPINLINVLFMGFMLIQVTYLFGGRFNINEQKFTYAQYARRGFAELVVVAVIIFGLILLFQGLSRRERPRHRLFFNASATLLLLLTVVLLVSAFKRLALYEAAYGFTTMRLYPHVFMVWLGVLLVWFVVTLWVAPRRLAMGMMLAAFGFVLTLNILNVEDFVVRHNAGRVPQAASFEVGRVRAPLDLSYITSLSDDAVPAMLAVLPQFSPECQQELISHLRERYRRMKHESRHWQWQSWNYGRWQAYRALQNYFTEVQ